MEGRYAAYAYAYRGSRVRIHGSLPQPPPPGTDVRPIDTLLSKTSNLSSLVNASVSFKIVAPLNVHGGALANSEFPPALGKQPWPPGSAGAQPVAKEPVCVVAISCHFPPTVTSPAVGRFSAYRIGNYSIKNRLLGRRVGLHQPDHDKRSHRYNRGGHNQSVCQYFDTHDAPFDSLRHWCDQ